MAAAAHNRLLAARTGARAADAVYHSVRLPARARPAWLADLGVADERLGGRCGRAEEHQPFKFQTSKPESVLQAEIWCVALTWW